MKGMKIGTLMAMLILLVGSVSAIDFYATDGGTIEVNRFGTGETVYAYGHDLAASHTYCIYTIQNVDSYYNGMTLIDISGNGPESVTTDGNGDFSPTAVWPAPLAAGTYDLVANYDCTGNYDGNYDEVDKRVGVGFTVPESVIAVALIALLIPGVIYVVRKRR